MRRELGVAPAEAPDDELSRRAERDRQRKWWGAEESGLLAPLDRIGAALARRFAAGAPATPDGA